MSAPSSRSSGSLVEVSIHIDPEAEEAVADVLERVFGQTPCTYSDLEKDTTRVSVFVEQCSRAQRVALNDGLALIANADIRLGSGQVRVRRIARENWAESWKKHFQPLEISPRLLVLPSWSKRKPKRGQAVVILDPGLSFGTGHHPTTAFCLEQIASFRDKRKKQSLLDMGCGSGILSIAAARLGYSPVVGFDFDPEAMRVAKENAALNRVRPRISRQNLSKLPSRSRRQFDMVCANLTYDLLIQDQQRILNRLAPGGVLVLAGILKEQFLKVHRAYETAGLKLVTSRIAKEWGSGSFSFQSEG